MSPARWFVSGARATPAGRSLWRHYAAIGSHSASARDLQVHEDGDPIAEFNDYWELAAHEVPDDEAASTAAAGAGGLQQPPRPPLPPHEQPRLIRMRHLPPCSDEKTKPVCAVTAPAAPA